MVEKSIEKNHVKNNNPRWNHYITFDKLKKLSLKYTPVQISKIFNAGESTIYKRLKFYNIKPYRPMRKFNCEICGELVKVIPYRIKAKYCSRKCYYIACKQKDMSILLKGHKWRDTKPECRVEKALNILGIKFQKHKHIGKYEIDFFLPDSGICLEAFGDYWHTKKDIAKRDAIKSKYLLSLGYRFLCYWEDFLMKSKIENIAQMIHEEIFRYGVGAPV